MKIVYITYLFTILLISTACKRESKGNAPLHSSARHAKDSVTTSEAPKGLAIKESAYKITQHQFATTETSVSAHLGNIISSYLSVKDDLVLSNPKSVAQSAAFFKRATKGFDKSYLTLNQKKVYDTYFEKISAQMQNLSELSDIEKQRSVFADLTQNIYQLALAFGYNNTLFNNECPMAQNGQGANWLSAEPEIKNPYYGSSMLSCGKIIEEIR